METRTDELTDKKRIWTAPYISYTLKTRLCLSIPKIYIIISIITIQNFFNGLSVNNEKNCGHLLHRSNRHSLHMEKRISHEYQ